MKCRFGFPLVAMGEPDPCREPLPRESRYLLLFPNRCSATSFLFHLLVYLSPKRQPLPSVDSQTVLTP